MTIYIESFLIQNILINFCLIKLVSSTLRPNTTFFKMLLASTMGAIFSVLSAIFIYNNTLLNITKLICSLTIIVIAFKQSKKQFIFSFILLYLYTYALGGAITSLSSNVYLTNFGAIMTSKFSLETITISIIIFTYLFELIANHLKFKFKSNGLYYNLTLTLNNNSIKLNAFLDTGNHLNYNGNPIIIVDLNSYLKLAKINIVEFYLQKTEELSTQTINGNNNLKLFKIDEIEIKNEKNLINLNNQFIAVNTSNCFKNSNFKALLSPLFL